jgi:tetratricopeptide (TPR) repeat protein
VRRVEAYGVALSAVVAVPLIAGGVRPWAVVPLFLCSVFVTWLGWRRGGAVPFSLWPLVGVFFLAALFVVPVPDSVASVVSPKLAQTRRFVWDALGAEAPRSGPLALNPAVAALDAVRAWSTLMLALAVVSRATRGGGMNALFGAIVCSAVLQVPLGLIFNEGRLSTFVNANHQAAFFSVAWLSALALRTADPKHRLVKDALSTLLCFAVVLSLSRAGIAAMFVGTAVFFAFSMRSRVWLAGAFVVAVALSSYAVSDRLGTRLAVRTEEKTRIWSQALRVVADSPLGTGRGGFGLAFNAVREPDRERGRWDYVENEYLQALTDYGPVVGAVSILCALAIVVAALWHARTRRSHRAAVAAILVMLALHGIFDFNWELLGLSLPVWLLIASLGRERGTVFHPVSPLPFRGVAVAGVVCVPLLAFGLTHAPESLDAKSLVKDRPLDAWAMVQLSHDALGRNDAKLALLWLNRAVTVDHDGAEPHLVLAELFCRSGHASQGRAEIRQALTRSSGDYLRIASALDLCIEKADDVLDVVDDPHAPHLADFFTHWSRHPEWLAAVAKSQPSRVWPDALRAQLFRAAAEVKDDALTRELSGPESPAVSYERGLRAWKEGRHDDALALYRAAAEAKVPGAAYRYVDALISTRQLAEAEEALPFVASNCFERRGVCVPYQRLKGDLYRAQKKPMHAFDEYSIAWQANPQDVDMAIVAADSLIEAGDRAHARRWLQEASARVTDSRLVAKLATIAP